MFVGMALDVISLPKVTFLKNIVGKIASWKPRCQESKENKNMS